MSDRILVTYEMTGCHTTTESNISLPASKLKMLCTKPTLPFFHQSAVSLLYILKYIGRNGERHERFKSSMPSKEPRSSTSREK
jgi:hypothetical protein